MPSGNAGVTPVRPARSSPVVERVEEAGGLIIGSTVMPDWGMLSSGVSSLHGITRSPWDHRLTTGGSSAGAGAAAAAGYGPLHVGTDIGGSIRLPGTWLGLTTLKPSAGRVPLDTPYLGRVAGPMTRTRGRRRPAAVGDQPPRLRATGPPCRPSASTSTWTLHHTDPPTLSATRVGLLLDAGCGTPLDPEVRAVVEAAAGVFASAGADDRAARALHDPRAAGAGSTSSGGSAPSSSSRPSTPMPRTGCCPSSGAGPRPRATSTAAS